MSIPLDKHTNAVFATQRMAKHLRFCFFEMVSVATVTLLGHFSSFRNNVSGATGIMLRDVTNISQATAANSRCLQKITAGYDAMAKNPNWM